MRLRHSRPPVLVSAHRCGAGDNEELQNSREALEAALELGVDYVEFDVQRCADGVLVVCHDAELDGDPIDALPHQEVLRRAPRLLTYREVLESLRGRAKAHIDLKFTSPDEAYADSASTDEVAATREALEVLGHDQLIVTTLADRSVLAVRDWADRVGEELLVGLSLGGEVDREGFWHQLRIRSTEYLPHLRYRRSRANLVVAHHWLARAGVAGFARRRRMPLLVWTVDTEESLHYWTRPGRAWLVTSNHPEVALRVRGPLSDSSP